MWIAHVNGHYRAGMNTSWTAREAAERAVEVYNEDIAAQGCDDVPLTLEVYRCDQAQMPRVGYRVPELLVEHWADHGPEGSNDLYISSLARMDLAERIDALVSQWAAEQGVGPDWYEAQNTPALTVKLDCVVSVDGEAAVVSDEAWAQLDALDAAGDAR